MVHALWVDGITADVRMEQQTVALATVMGAKRLEMPDLNDRLAEMEKWLASEPQEYDPETLELRQALGLRHG